MYVVKEDGGEFVRHGFFDSYLIGSQAQAEKIAEEKAKATPGRRYHVYKVVKSVEAVEKTVTQMVPVWYERD